MTIYYAINLVAGAIISLIAELIPAFTNLTELQKRYTMLGVLVLSTILIGAASCLGWLQTWAPDLQVQCTESGLLQLLAALVTTIVGNQGTHMLIKKA